MAIDVFGFLKIVHMEVYGMEQPVFHHINVHQINIGITLLVLTYHVQMVKILIQILNNVNVHMDNNGMVKLVLVVQVEEYGYLDNVSAHLVNFGMVIYV